MEGTEQINTEAPIGGEVNETAEADQMREDLHAALQNTIGKKEVVQENNVESETVRDEVPNEKEPVAEEAKEITEEDLFPVMAKDWSKEEKERFTSALDTPELKEAASVFTERYEQLKKGFYKKAEETADMKKSASAWNDIFDDNAKESLGKRGISEQQYTKQLLHIDRQLSQDPAGTLKRLMEGYKVTPEQLGLSTSNEAKDDFYKEDNKIDQLTKEIADMKATAQQKEAAKVETANQSVQDQLRDFKFAINDDGETLYPMFEEVKTEMSILLETGKANTLEEAYKASPTVREKVLEAKSYKASERALEADRKKVKDAKRASRGVVNKKSVPTSSNRRMTIEEHLADSFRKAGAL